MSDPNIEILRFETFLKAIENSVGTTTFNSLMVKHKDSGTISDILNNGEFSCAFFVSSLLTMFQILDKPNATVKSLEERIQNSAEWEEVDIVDTMPGDVVFYAKVKYEDDSSHAHVGFVINTSEAVSTSFADRCVKRHQLKNRPITSIYRFKWGNTGK